MNCLNAVSATGGVGCKEGLSPGVVCKVKRQLQKCGGAVVDIWDLHSGNPKTRAEWPWVLCCLSFHAAQWAQR